MERKEIKRMIEELEKEIEDFTTPEMKKEAEKGVRLIDRFIEDTEDISEAGVYACISMIIDEHCKRVGMCRSRFLHMLSGE